MNDSAREPDLSWPCDRPMRIALVLVAKAAVSGRVKTRLISPLVSAQQAADVQIAFLKFLRNLVETLAESGSHRFPQAAVGAAPQLSMANTVCTDDFVIQPLLFIDPLGQPLEQFNWPGWRTIFQPPGDLGDRMRFCAQVCLAEKADAMIFIGVDSVHLNLALLRWMAQDLLKSQAVMLPAHDGGYVALGLRPEALPLLDNIAWGSALVCRQTLDRAVNLRIALSIGDQLPDVDTPDDLRLVMAAMASRQDNAARELYTCLRSMMIATHSGDTRHDESRND